MSMKGNLMSEVIINGEPIPTYPLVAEKLADLEHALLVCRADANRATGTSWSEMGSALKTIIMTADNALNP